MSAERPESTCAQRRVEPWKLYESLCEREAAPQPILLDLFCGAGGCAKGYRDAGFYVIGVDIEDQPRYAGDHFVQGDALDVLRLLVGGLGVVSPEDDADELLRVGELELAGFRERGFGVGAGVDFAAFDTHAVDEVGHAIHHPKPASAVKAIAAIHASPPCQDYSKALRHMASPQPRLIGPVRELLEQTGLPWVIENVVGAPLPSQDTLDGRHGVELCGTMFGLRIGWHRLFESNVPLAAPTRPCRCGSIHVVNPHNQAGRDRIYAEFGPGDPESHWRRERGTEWMTRYEAREAVPPAFTEFIGPQLLAQIPLEAAA